jgi:hypothetical protein
MFRRTHGCAAISITIAAGCGGGPAPAAPVAPAAEAALLRPEECPATGCGLNGTWLGANIPFRELDLGPPGTMGEGEANSAGLRIASFQRARDDSAVSESLHLDVQGDELIGVRSPGTCSTTDCSLRGPSLVGAVLKLVDANDKYLLTIKSVRNTVFWTETCEPIGRCDPTDTVPLYEITFTRAGQTKEESPCSPLTAQDRDDERGIDGLVMVFRGDRYKDRGYVVEADAESTWFNIACAGTAIAKLHLLRHTTASARMTMSSVSRVATLPPRRTTLAQRQTILRMLTADYCGIGAPFTEDGHPLSYTFRQRWEPLQPRTAGASQELVPFSSVANASLDALWDQHGAVCLGTPRLSARKPAATPTQKRKIRAVCEQARRRGGLRTSLPRTELPDCPPGALNARYPAAFDDLSVQNIRPYAVSANPERAGAPR